MAVNGIGEGSQGGEEVFNPNQSEWDLIAATHGQDVAEEMMGPRPSEDMGGPHAGRGPVWIGSGQQPELFWPNEAGTFYPASRFGGGDAVNNWTVNLYGIQDMKQALDELEREARRRNRRLTVGMGGAG